jgi:hypothetical protein
VSFVVKASACAYLSVSKNNSEARRKSTRHSKRINNQTSKRRGELAELAFLFKAASLGFTVAKPYGDSDRYDFILDTGQRLYRVQVKSASRLSQGAYFLTTQRCCNGVGIPYTSDEIDFLAGYVFPEDAWVVIPVEALEGRKSIHIFPRDRQQHGIYAHYREAWCQLACPRAAESAGAADLEPTAIEPRCRGQHSHCPLHRQPPIRCTR